MSNYTFLVIDDDEDILGLFESYYKNNYEEVTLKLKNTSSNILEKIKEYNPHIVILDYNLPFKNGLEALKEIRKYYNPLQLPVLIMTAMDKIYLMEEVFKEGGNDFLVKPLNLNIAHSRILGHLRLTMLGETVGNYRENDNLSRNFVESYCHLVRLDLRLALKKIDTIHEKNSPIFKDLSILISRSIDKIAMLQEAADDISEKEEELNEIISEESKDGKDKDEWYSD